MALSLVCPTWTGTGCAPDTHSRRDAAAADGKTASATCQLIFRPMGR